MRKSNLLLAAVLAMFTMFVIYGCGGGGSSSQPQSPTPVAATVPGPPTNVVAVAGNGQITVSFTAPASDGGSAITGYVVTASGGQTATGVASPTTVTVPNNVAYTCTVKAINSVGSSVASAVSNSVTPSAPPVPGNPTVNGTAGQKLIDPSGNQYIVTLRSQDVYVTKFNSANILQWEKPVLVTANWDECKAAAFLDGKLYFICIKDDVTLPGLGTGVILFEALDSITGNNIKESTLSTFGAARGLEVDQTTGLLYSYYDGLSGGFEIVIDPVTGTIINGTPEKHFVQGANALDEIFGITVVGSDGIYAIGSITQNGGQGRIYVVKFSKDLTTRIWTAQYRNFSDSLFLDGPSSASMQNGNLIVEGNIDVLGNAKAIKLQVNAATGIITVL